MKTNITITTDEGDFNIKKKEIKKIIRTKKNIIIQLEYMFFTYCAIIKKWTFVY